MSEKKYYPKKRYKIFFGEREQGPDKTWKIGALRGNELHKMVSYLAPSTAVKITTMLPWNTDLEETIYTGTSGQFSLKVEQNKLDENDTKKLIDWDDFNDMMFGYALVCLKECQYQGDCYTRRYGQIQRDCPAWAKLKDGKPIVYVRDREDYSTE